jgi:hypothetical protein
MPIQDRNDAQTSHALRHDLIQPATVAVLLIEDLKRRNRDESLQPSIELLEKALADLASKIENLYPGSGPVARVSATLKK